MEDNSFHFSTWLHRHLEGRDTLKWLVSHVFIYLGMILLILGYCILGALTFQYLENNAIHAKRAKVGTPACWSELQVYTRDNRTTVLQNLYNVTEKLLIHQVQSSLEKDKELDQDKIDEWVLAAKLIIEDYETKIKVIQKDSGLCEAERAVGDDWAFKTALLFATTVVTTIGYGNRTPESWQGRLATLLYAMLGVPLMLFSMRTLGRSIGTLLDHLYKYVQDSCRCRRDEQDDKLFTSTGDASVAADTASPQQDGGLVLPPTVQAGETSTGAPGPRPLITMTPADEDGQIRTEYQRDQSRRRSRRRSHGASPSLQLRVPLAVIFVITTMYNFIGAALFSHYEHWSFLDGFYFTFITISTIGFGDLVPKILSDKDPDYGGVPAWWVETSYVVYVMVGLTVIQMSFELTKETINNQFYSLGRSAGLIESQQEDGAAEPGMERQLSEPGEGELRRRHRRATRRHHSGGSRGMSLRTPWGDRSLDNGGSSPSMRSAEPGSGQPSTEVSSAESVPRPVRPKSARPRRSEQYRDEY